MRILIISPYISLDNALVFSKNKTGFGYMVFDIAKSLAVHNDVSLLLTDSRGSGCEYEGVKILRRSFFLSLKYLYTCIPFWSLIFMWRKYHMHFSSFIRLIYYWLMTGWVSNIIVNGGYDIVHIHGCSFATDYWIHLCKHFDKKFYVTLHGLNSFSDSIIIEKARKQYELDFLERVTNGEFPITVISTGMKKKIEGTYNKANCSNIKVVCNSFSFSDIQVSDKKPIREKYNIPLNAKLFLYVGNISHNKNQLQIVRAYNILPKEIQENLYILFCGKNNMKENILYEAISRSPFPTHLVTCGAINKQEMPSYYQAADGVTLLSIEEGFGLSLIEGMHFGLPCAMFSDMDAFEDIYTPDAVVPIEKRDDKSVTDALTILFSRTWNKEEIKKISNKFNSEYMVSKYINAFNSLISQN